MAKKPTVEEVLQLVKKSVDVEAYKERHWRGSFRDYLKIVLENPDAARNAWQRLYDMILSYGTREYTRFKERIVHYNFFDDPIDNGKDAIYGLDKALMRLVNIIKSGAYGYGPERRVLLLHGPVGSSKSTIVRLLKKGLEAYSKTPEGVLYSFSWKLEDGSEFPCPMNEEPLRLLPEEAREEVLERINATGKSKYRIEVEGDLCPACRWYFRHFISKYDGDWAKMIDEHIIVRRIILSEKDRIGIGTFQPKDEKNQDSTELTGDINYRKIAIYGSDSDPRAFNFDGELNIANRGLIEFIEILKLDVAFLYDLLSATQEHKIKPKKFPQTDIDEVIIGHTNEPEYRRLQNNELMEAFRDRTLKIDIPYVVRLDDEVRIYEKEFNPRKIIGKHIAPHTIEVASMWAILTRLKEPKNQQISLIQKLKLYNDKMLPGFTEDHVKELMEEAEHEAMEGISPRYIQDKISNALVREDTKCVNPFMVLRELEDGLYHHSLITSDQQRKRYKELIAVVRQEYEEIVKNEVQRAISADKEALQRLCDKYIENVMAYLNKERVKNPITGEFEEPDERFMRAIEEKIDIPESRKDDFRREIMNYIGTLAVKGKKFDYRSNERLRRALELKLFDDQKDTIRLSTLVTSVIDKETQEKIDIVKSRLIRDFGYCEICATDVLNFVASLFARSEERSKEQK